MRTPFRQRPELPTSPLPVRDPLGRDLLGWCPTASETAGDMTAWSRAGSPAETCGLVLHALDNGLSQDRLALDLAATLGARDAGLLDPLAWCLADVARLAAELDAERSGLPWAWMATLVAERAPALRPRAPQPQPSATSTLEGAIANRHPGEAAAAVVALLDAGAGSRDVLARLATLACLHPGDAGVGAVAVAKIADLGGTVGDEGLGSLLADLARALAGRTQEHPWTLAHHERMESLGPRLREVAGLRDEQRAKAFVEPKFRVHLVDGKPEQAVRACQRAAEAGIPHELLAQSLSLASAERLLRADPRWDLDTTVAETTSDCAHLLVLASAVRQLRTLAEPAAWLELLCFAAGLTAASAALDRPARDQGDLPDPAQIHQTWDHGPEIAKIVTQLHAGQGQAAIAILRAYFLLVLPEQPLCTQLREASLADRFGPAVEAARAVAVMAAAIDEFQALSAHPHRERVLAAALSWLASPPAPRGTLAVAESALQRMSTGWRVATLVISR